MYISPKPDLPMFPSADVRVRQICSLFFLLGMLASAKLWFGPRTFPLLPVWDVPAADLLRLSGVVLLVMVLGISCFASNRYLLIALVFLLILEMALDLMKVQPWVYFYGWMLCAGLFSDPGMIRRWVVLAMYGWGGIHKLNPAYFASCEGSLAVPMSVVPFLEILLAIGLWYPKSRVVALIGSILLHIGIVIFIWAAGENERIILWNIAIPWINVLLFRGFRDRMDFPFRQPAHGVAISFLLLSPVAACAIQGVDYVCWAVYAERNRDFWIAIPEESYDSFGKEINYAIDYRDMTGGKLVSMNRFALMELHVPFVGAEPAYARIARIYEDRAPGKLRFVEYERPFRLGRYRNWVPDR